MDQLLVHWSRVDAAAWVVKTTARDRVTAAEHNSMVVALATIQDALAAPWDVLGPNGEPAPQRVTIDGQAIPLIGAIEPRDDLFADETGPARLARWHEIAGVLASLSLAQAADDRDASREGDVELVLLCAPASYALVHAEPATVVEEPAGPAWPMAPFVSESILLARNARMSDRPPNGRREQAELLMRAAAHAGERMFAAAGASAAKTMWKLLRRRAA
jgi:hypothetical protein